MGKVTVVGSYIVALVMDVDRIPLEGETVFGGNYHTTHGGKGSNMAACSARLEAETGFLGKIGRDPFGEGFLRLLEREGVSRETVLFSDKLPTAVGFIVFSARGTNLIVIDRGPTAISCRPTWKCMRRRSAMPMSPFHRSKSPWKPHWRRRARRNRPGGSSFSIRPRLRTCAHDLRNVFAITPNARESRVCLGLQPDDPISDRDAALRLRELGVEHVMMTRGEKGVLWVSPSGIQVVPALPVQVVDSVGAGDAFNAGLAVGLSEGKPVGESIALGVTAALLSTQHRETIESYHRRPEVDAHLPQVLRSIGPFVPRTIP